MRIEAKAYQTLFKRPFTTSHGTRTGTEVILLEISHSGYKAYGEASIPPYRKCSPNELIETLRKAPICDVSKGLEACLNHYASHLSGSPEGLAAYDMALHDLFAKIQGQTVAQLIGAKAEGPAQNMYTIAAAHPKEVEERIEQAPQTDIFKIKLTGKHDTQILEEVSRFTDRPIFIDANQGWKSLEDFSKLLPTLEHLELRGLEQPFPVGQEKLARQLSDKYGVAVFADENFEGIDDLGKIGESFTGINIKLMKCGGIRNAKHIIDTVYNSGLSIMLGSMSETTCGTSAAMQLAGYAELLDQDGPWLLSNDPFTLTSGKGLGVEPTA